MVQNHFTSRKLFFCLFFPAEVQQRYTFLLNNVFLLVSFAFIDLSYQAHFYCKLNSNKETKAILEVANVIRDSGCRAVMSTGVTL